MLFRTSQKVGRFVELQADCDQLSGSTNSVGRQEQVYVIYYATALRKLGPSTQWNAIFEVTG